MPTEKADVVVIGGGIIGLAIARELAGDGRAVIVLERGRVGREASWAAGGILSPVHPWTYPPALAHLASASLARWPALCAALLEETGVDSGYREGGLVSVVERGSEGGLDELRRQASWFAEHDTPAELLDGAGLRDRVGLENPRIEGALYLPGIAQVRNTRVTRALAIAAARRGARIHESASVEAFDVRDGVCRGVTARDLRIEADHVILAAGAWSGALSRALPGTDPLPVEPARGQMIVVETEPVARPLAAMVMGEDQRYVIPRPDGRVLVGSTVERVGFDKRVTTETVGELARRAGELVPSLGRAVFARAYAGLRPATPDRLPFIGPVPGVAGLIAATGHFRNGILLAAVTAAAVAALVAGRDAPIDLDAVRPGRPMPESDA